MTGGSGRSVISNLEQRQHRAYVDAGRLEQFFADAAAQVIQMLIRRVSGLLEECLPGKRQPVRVDSARVQAYDEVAVDEPLAEYDAVERD
jgi:hypothetical protein